MDDMEPVPAGWELIGAFGVLLAAPAEWNPVVLHAQREGGLRRKLGLRTEPFATGMIGCADLRKTRVEVRWRTHASGERASRALASHVARLKRAGAIIIQLEDALGIVGGKDRGTTAWEVLAVIGRRVYELHLPDGQTSAGRSLVEWFVRANGKSGHATGERFWSLYGAQGWAPWEAVVRRMSLHPGKVELVLSFKGGRLTLGCNGLADHLLGETPGGQPTLAAWARATGAGRIGAAIGQWTQVSQQEIAFSGTLSQRFCRRVRHTFRVRHDPQANRIAWQHMERWGGPGIQEEPAASADTRS
jgi:hypothetical protein